VKFTNQIPIFLTLTVALFAQQPRQQDASDADAEVSPELFGGIGDGNADDTLALSKAIATGKHVVAMPGRTYKTTSSITVSTPNQTLDFRNAKIKPMGSFDAFNITQSQVTIRQINVDAAALTGVVFKNSSAVQQLLFEHVHITNSSADAMQWRDIYLSWFRDVHVTAHRGTAFHAYSTIPGTPVNSLWLENCNFSDGRQRTNTVLLEGVSGIWINTSSFQNNVSGSTDIRIRSNGNAGVSGVTIKDSYFETAPNHTGNNIYIGDPEVGTIGHENVFVVGNYFQSSKQNIRVGKYVANSVALVDNAFVFVAGPAVNAIAVSGSPNPRVIRGFGSFAPGDNWTSIRIPRLACPRGKTAPLIVDQDGLIQRGACK
jgi:hypothetical protein